MKGLGSKSSKNTRVETILEARDLTIRYGSAVAIKSLSLAIPVHQITAIIGPSGCGKSTLLRSFNRMNDMIDSMRIEGEVLFHGENLYAPAANPVAIRLRIGMVFQKPNPFPKSIWQNVAWAPNLHGIAAKNGRDAKRDLDELVESSLVRAGLWNEVKDRLHQSGYALSGGQQQRLCIARALAIDPEVLLMDEPCSALDPISTARIEDLLDELRESVTIVTVTHNMQQAARASDFTAFLDAGELIEFGDTEQVFTLPRNPRTEDYVSGRFG